MPEFWMPDGFPDRRTAIRAIAILIADPNRKSKSELPIRAPNP